MNEILEDNETRNEAGEMHIASSFTRFINYLTDSIFLSILLSFFMPDVKIDPAQYETLSELFKDPLVTKILVINYAGMLAYYFVCESLFGQTLGKFITRTHVVNDFGQKPGFLQILGRTLCRIIPFEAFSFLFTPIGWHDSISKTYVVKK